MVQTEVMINTITPLWTSGVPGMADHLHATGIMGSLRWWYEALVRGMGGHACDPSTHGCICDQTAPPQGLCDACSLFGATGWKRRFRLIADEEKALQLRAAPPINATLPRLQRGRGPQPPRWFFGDGKSLVGSATLRLVANEPSDLAVIGGLIQFVTTWASLGAKAQMGFGLVRVEQPQDTDRLLERLRNIPQSPPDPTLPSLRDMFFTRVSPRESARFADNETFNLKYDLRQQFRGKPDTPQHKALRHFVMGTVEGNQRQHSKVMISRPFEDNTKINLWGWIPTGRHMDNRIVPVNRANVVQTIHAHLASAYHLDCWREFNSGRDSLQTYTDIDLFLLTLLEYIG